MKVLVRADASVTLGTGHVMRCLTLAEGLRAQGADVRFACRLLPGNLVDALKQRGYGVDVIPGGDLGARADAATIGQDARDTQALARAQRPDWLVVDTYALDSSWHRTLRPSVGKILAIDDLAEHALDVDVVLNQNLHASDALYEGKVPAGCTRLLGPRHALLRPEFAALRAQQRERSGRLERVLVVLGGADADNVTGRVVEALRGYPGPLGHLDVVAGASNPHVSALEALCARIPGARFHHAIPDLATLMAQADFCIGAAGSTTWERACLGVPTLMLVLAPNQLPLAQAMAQRLAALWLPAEQLGPAILHDVLGCLAAQPDLLRGMSRNASALVDGRGTARVLRAMLGPGITLRRATEGDRDALFGWRNDESVRRFSNDPAPIPRAAHDRWFSAVLADRQRCLLVAERGGVPAGVLRYDLDGDEALVSIYLVPGQAGQGLGPAILRAGTEWLRAERPDAAEIVARILPGNGASHAAFVEAGYRLDASEYRLPLR